MSVKIPWGPVGYIVYKRTYSRSINDIKTEEFPDTVERLLKGCQQQLKCNFSDSELQDVKNMMLELKGLPAGRFLWQLGTSTVKNLGLASLQNCSATVVNNPIRPFTWTMDMLMLGSGVGYNIQKEYVYELPKVKKVKIIRQDTKDADFIVPDSRAGWVKLLEYVLNSHFYTGENFSYSTMLIRGKGAAIKGFGGVASGPEELCYGIEQINNVLNSRAGKKLRPVDCLDIMNIIGYIVVAGNVRRSAQLALGDMDDLQYLNAKKWDLGSIPNWRSMSNNSIVCNDVNQIPNQFWDGYCGNGEPYGLVNLALSRKIGRIGETQYCDPDVVAYNPCCEQSLEEGETCCLQEIFLPNISSPEELFSVAKNLYRIAKHSLALKCHHKDTEYVVHKNMRMGIGLTGILQCTDKIEWLDECYKKLREYDKEYSKKNDFPSSIKLTTVKPSGTLSLLAGTTSGIHPGYSQYYLRRIRIASNSPLIEIIKNHGYNIEYQRNFDNSIDRNTMIAEFPCSHPEGTVLTKDLSAIDQLENIKTLQKVWSDNAVSCTIYYKKEELGNIKEWLLANYNNNIKTCSFLLHSEHGFNQAPLEEITENQYIELKNKTKPIELVNFGDGDIVSEYEECIAGSCPVK